MRLNRIHLIFSGNYYLKGKIMQRCMFNSYYCEADSIDLEVDFEIVDDDTELK